MHAEFAEQTLSVGQHVHQVRDRRALIAADIGHARLQQRLGDREDSLAVKGLVRAEAQRLDLFRKGPFRHRAFPKRFPAKSYPVRREKARKNRKLELSPSPRPEPAPAKGSPSRRRFSAAG